MGSGLWSWISFSFNPRPCVRGDNLDIYNDHIKGRFNPRPCVRGDPVAQLVAAAEELFQSTPLCEGRLAAKFNTFRIHCVSIHAPV